jgi:hypothetical protein
MAGERTLMETVGECYPEPSTGGRRVKASAPSVEAHLLS